jgi:trimethylamine--corrinoid protein Co-methyltransferase
LYLPGPVYDRTNREQFARAGGRELVERAGAEVDRRLAAFVSPYTDPAVEAEMLRIIRSGLNEQDAALPDVPPPALKGAEPAVEDRRAARRRARQR